MSLLPVPPDRVERGARLDTRWERASTTTHSRAARSVPSLLFLLHLDEQEPSPRLPCAALRYVASMTPFLYMGAYSEYSP